MLSNVFPTHRDFQTYIEPDIFNQVQISNIWFNKKHKTKHYSVFQKLYKQFITFVQIRFLCLLKYRVLK